MKFGKTLDYSMMLTAPLRESLQVHTGNVLKIVLTPQCLLENPRINLTPRRQGLII